LKISLFIPVLSGGAKNTVTSKIIGLIHNSDSVWIGHGIFFTLG